MVATTAAIEAVCADVIEVADDHRREYVDGLDLDRAVALAALIERARLALRHLRSEADRAVLAALGDDREALVGGVAVQRRSSSRHRWDNASLVSRIVTLAREDRHVDPDTGITEDPGDAVQRALIDAYGLDLPSRAPRLGWLRDHGLDPDDWRQTEWGAPSVQLTLPDGGRR